MTTITTTATTSRPLSASAVLLLRRFLLTVPTSSTASQDAGPGPVGAVSDGVTLLEADLLERGYLLSPAARAALCALDEPTLALVGTTALADIDTALGANRTHTPLFRKFPDGVPADTTQLFVNRVLTVLFQVEDIPCVLCGTEGNVHPVSPCGHLVCRSCFDGSNYSACPICHRHIDAGDPFLKPLSRRGPLRQRRVPDRVAVLGVTADAEQVVRDQLHALLGRGAALTPAESDDLAALLATRSRTDLSWVLPEVPGRETKAALLAWLLDDASALEHTGPAVAQLVTTATDVLRVLVVRAGGDAGLVTTPRFTAVPRPVRRALLAAMDALDVDDVAADLTRHRGLWLAAGERLHPFEYATRYPRVATAFASLRSTKLREDALALAVVDQAKSARTFVADFSAVRAVPLTPRVEVALANGDLTKALALLIGFPGMLLRRLDHLLRLAAQEDAETGNGAMTAAVLAEVGRAAASASPAVVLSTLGALRVRGSAQPRRVFFPKGGSAKVHVVADTRAPLPQGTVDRVVADLTEAVLDRAQTLPALRRVLVDEALGSVVAPFSTRTFSKSLVTLPRGTALPLPAGRSLRLFVHWMESDARVDLDLSVAFYDDAWELVGMCDYTHLRMIVGDRDGATHSGDLTSAPPPVGASEFVDLDVDALRAGGVRHVVPVVFSYNNVAFEDMADAFAGFMSLDSQELSAGPVFDAGAVEQRFDLTGRSRAAVPMVVDLELGTMRWVDLVRGVTGTNHNVHRHQDDLAELGQAVQGLFGSGARVSMGEVATWLASARSATVLVRRLDGSVAEFTREPSEVLVAFAQRVAAGVPDRVLTGEQFAVEPAVDAAYVVRGDVPVRAGAPVFAVYRGLLDPNAVTLVEAAQVVDDLAGA